MASLIPSVLSGYKPCGLLSFTDPSWRHFDTHNSRVLRLGSIRLWNFWQKPRCVAVTDSVLISNSTAAVHITLTSGPAKLQSSLNVVMVTGNRRLLGTLDFKFQNPSGVSDALCTYAIPTRGSFLHKFIDVIFQCHYLYFCRVGRLKRATLCEISLANESLILGLALRLWYSYGKGKEINNYFSWSCCSEC